MVLFIKNAATPIELMPNRPIIPLFTRTCLAPDTFAAARIMFHTAAMQRFQNQPSHRIPLYLSEHYA